MSRRVLVLIALSVFFQGEASFATDDGQCELKMLWGHGMDAEDSTHRILDHEGKTCVVAQGCWVGKLGNVPGRVDQQGPNGEWMSFLGYESNGGMNPRLSLESPRKIDLESHAEKVRFRDLELDYLIKRYPLWDLKERVAEVNAVGFVRMSHYHWLLLHQQALNRLESGQCSEVKVQFQCVSKDRDQEVWEKRVRLATETGIYSQFENQKIQFSKKSCGLDLQGKSVESLPARCGETHHYQKAQLAKFKCSPTRSYGIDSPTQPRLKNMAVELVD